MLCLVVYVYGFIVFLPVHLVKMNYVLHELNACICVFYTHRVIDSDFEFNFELKSHTILSQTTREFVAKK